MVSAFVRAALLGSLVVACGGAEPPAERPVPLRPYEVLQHSLGQVSACWDRRTRKNGPFLRMQATIGADGKVTETRTVSSNTEDAVATCVGRELKALQFHTSSDGKPHDYDLVVEVTNANRGGTSVVLSPSPAPLPANLSLGHPAKP